MKIVRIRQTIIIFAVGAIIAACVCGCSRQLLRLPAGTIFSHLNFAGPLGSEIPPCDYYEMVVDGDTIELYHANTLLDYSMGRFLIKQRYDGQYEFEELKHPGSVTDSVLVAYVPQERLNDTIKINVIFNSDLEWQSDYFTISSDNENLSYKSDESCEYHFSFEVPASRDSVSLRADRHMWESVITELRPTYFDLGTFALRPGHDLTITFPYFNRERSWYAPIAGELFLYHKGNIYWRGMRFLNIGRVAKKDRKDFYKYRRMHGPADYFTIRDYSRLPNSNHTN